MGSKLDPTPIILKLIEVYGHNILLWAGLFLLFSTALFLLYSLIYKKFIAAKPPATVSLDDLKEQFHLLGTTLLTHINHISERLKEYNAPDKVDIILNVLYYETILGSILNGIEKLYYRQDLDNLPEKLEMILSLAVSEIDKEVNKISNVKEAMIPSELKIRGLLAAIPAISQELTVKKDFIEIKENIKFRLRTVVSKWAVR